MLKIYFTLPTATFREAAKVIDFSKDFICFFFIKIPLHGTRNLNHLENNCSTNYPGNCVAKIIEK